MELKIKNLTHMEIMIAAMMTTDVPRRELWMAYHLGDKTYAKDDKTGSVIELALWRGRYYFLRDFEPNGGIKDGMTISAIKHFLTGLCIVGFAYIAALLIEEPQNLIRFLSLPLFWSSLFGWPLARFSVAIDHYKFQGFNAYVEASIETIAALAGSYAMYHWIWS